MPGLNGSPEPPPPPPRNHDTSNSSFNDSKESNEISEAECDRDHGPRGNYGGKFLLTKIGVRYWYLLFLCKRGLAYSIYIIITIAVRIKIGATKLQFSKFFRVFAFVHYSLAIQHHHLSNHHREFDTSTTDIIQRQPSPPILVSFSKRRSSVVVVVVECCPVNIVLCGHHHQSVISICVGAVEDQIHWIYHHLHLSNLRYLISNAQCSIIPSCYNSIVYYIT